MPTQPTSPAAARLNNRIKHSVCRWCYGGIKLEDLCTHAREIGISSIELLGETEWPVVAAAGLSCAVANGPTGITKGLNRPDLHDGFMKESERLLPLIKRADIPTMIVFSGNRTTDLNDADGLKNCVAGLKRLVPLAEQHGVTIIMELLNSKVDHKEYMCDRTRWGLELVQRVASDRFKLLYDIYHMQIMEGDVIRTVTDNIKAIAHFHTGGVPGRNEIDDTQELDYRSIVRAIVNAGYAGYLGQEFIPRRDPMTSLRDAVLLCDV